MEPKKMLDITQMSILELKALAFDVRNEMDLLGRNLQTVMMEIQKKSQIPDALPKEETGTENL